MCETKRQKIEKASEWEAAATGNMTVERGSGGQTASNPSKRLVNVSRLMSGVGGHDI